MKNTTENNKLIAEFDGHLINYGHNQEGVLFHGNHISAEKLLYHTNWDWLMPVVEKIEKLNYDFKILGGNWVIITDIDPDRNESEEIIEIGDKESKLKAAYTAVVEFIKWYSVPELKWTEPPEKDILNEVKMLVDTGDNIEYTRGVLEIVTSFMKGPDDFCHVDKVITLAHKIGIDEENIKKMY